jgi:hypothetical protein
MAAAIQVTPRELAELAIAVGRILDQLQGTADLLHDYAPAMGSPVVTDALAHFVSGWRDGRKQICAEVDALSQMLAQAAAAYARTDGDLAAAIPAS